MTRVKVCGMMDEGDLGLAAQCGADAVGFVVEVPSSRRSLSAGAARALIEKVPVFTTSVAVMVPGDYEEAADLALRTGADLVQVHGDLDADDLLALKRLIPQKVVAAMPALPGSEDLAVEISGAADALLLDTYRQGVHGGTGRVHDWEISARIASRVRVPVILAGGLGPENVEGAIRAVHPYAVDVSSGVESNGRKDDEKVKSFIKAVRECELTKGQPTYAGSAGSRVLAR